MSDKAAGAQRGRFRPASRAVSADRASKTSSAILYGNESAPTPGSRGQGALPGDAIVRAVVLIVSVVVLAFTPSGVIEFGEAAHVDAVGAPLHATVTAALNPNDGVTVTVKVAELPATIAPEVGEVLTAKSEPEPPRDTV